jgi:hypothetical protein
VGILRRYDVEPDFETGMVIQDTPQGYTAGCDGTSVVGGCVEWDDVWAAVKEWMDEHSYYPDIYHVNDHGNVSLLDADGNEVRGWV